MYQKKRFKIAFIGAGYMTNEHLKVFNDIGNVHLAGIYSRTRSKAEALALEFGIQRVSSSINDLYKTTEADAVVISVSELETKKICTEVFKYPWISLIEKPVGYNLKEARFILKVADYKSRDVYVALNRRHYSSSNVVLNGLNGADGKRLITIYDQEDAEEALAAGRPKLIVDNWMYANSIHLIDLFNLFGRGEIVKVEPLVHWDPENPFLVMAKLEFDSGDIGLYNAVWNAPGPWAVTVSTGEKRFEMRPLESAQYQNRGERKLTSYSLDDWDNRFKPGLRKQAELFIKAIDTGEKELLPTLKNATKTMELISKIYENG